MKVRLFLFLALTIVVVASAWFKVSDEMQKGTSLQSSLDTMEEKLAVIVSQQKKENAEQRTEIEMLRKEIDILKNKSEDNADTGMETQPVGEKFTYIISDNGAIITGYTGKDTYIVIPSHVDGYAVSGIGESAFAYSKVNTVIISEGIKTVDWFAFYACPTLTSITLPKSIESIGYSAFEGASANFTVYCYSKTYSHDYVKSYGISHIAA